MFWTFAFCEAATDQLPLVARHIHLCFQPRKSDESHLAPTPDCHFYRLIDWYWKTIQKSVIVLAGTSMYESGDIVKYLFNNYGDGRVPWGLSLGIFTALSCGFALIPRYVTQLYASL